MFNNIKIKYILGGVLILLVVFFSFLFLEDRKANEEFAKEQILFDNGDIDGAISSLEEKLEGSMSRRKEVSILISLSTSLAQKGSLSFEEKKYGEKALSFINRAIEIDPKNAGAYRVKGYIYEIMEKYNLSFQAYDKSIELDKKSSLGYSGRGHAKYLFGKIDEAKEDYLKAVEIDRSNIHAVLNLARLYMEQGELDETMNLFSNMDLYTENKRLQAEVLQLIGVLSLMSESFEDAQDFFSLSLEVDNTLVSSWTGLAESKYFLLMDISKEDRENEIQNIFTLLEEALNRNQSFSYAYILAGKVSRLIGDEESALVFLNKAKSVVNLDISLSSGEKVKVLETIEFLIKGGIDDSGITQSIIEEYNKDYLNHQVNKISDYSIFTKKIIKTSRSVVKKHKARFSLFRGINEQKFSVKSLSEQNSLSYRFLKNTADVVSAGTYRFRIGGRVIVARGNWNANNSTVRWILQQEARQLIRRGVRGRGACVNGTQFNVGRRPPPPPPPRPSPPPPPRPSPPPPPPPRPSPPPPPRPSPPPPPPRPVCGDGICSVGESVINCFVDCPPVCGDGTCSAGETVYNCRNDCLPTCGDNICQGAAGENVLNCSDDCSPVCGDGICSAEAGENEVTCVSDCNPIPGNGLCGAGEQTSYPLDCAPVCGDGTCESNRGENFLNCSSDCSFSFREI